MMFNQQITRLAKHTALFINKTLLQNKKVGAWGTLHKEVIGLSFLSFAHCTIKKSR